MPIYEYKCNHCEKQHEVYQSINEANLDCPDCHNTMNKLISLCGLVGDEMPKTYCEATGQYWESRSGRNNALKEMGVVAVDKNWTAPKKKENKDEVLREIQDDLKETYQEITSGNSDVLTEAEIAECNELDAKDGYKPIKL